MTTPTTPEPGRRQGDPASGPEFRYTADQPADFRYMPSSDAFRQNTAPEPVSVGPSPTQDHPAWCARKPDAEGGHDWHTSGWVEASHPNQQTVVKAALTGTLDESTGRWVLCILVRATDVPHDVEVREYLLALEQAETFGAALVQLVAVGKAAT